MKRSLFSIALLTISLISSGESAIALSQGDSCSQLNRIKKVGKVEFKCVGTESQKYWVQLPSVIPIQKSATQSISKWTTTVQSISFGPFISQSDIDAANSDLLTTTQSAKLIQDGLSKSDELKKAYEANSINFTSSAQKLTALVVEKKKTNDSKLEEYTSALKKTNAYYSQYQAAISSRTASVSCTVLKTFGFVGSCVNNPFQDALDVQTIRNYDSLKAASDLASTEFKSANADWLVALKLESKELQKAKLATDSADIHSQRYSEWKNLSQLRDTQQAYVQAFLDLADAGGGLQSEFSNFQTQTLKDINGIKSANKQNYKSKFQTASISVEFLKIANRYYQAQVNETSEYSPLQISIVEPQIWKPSSYFKGSSYSYIENTSGIEFAWSWSNRSSCELSSSCKNLFIVTDKDCPRSVIGLDFVNASNVSEAKTFSREYPLKGGEISLIEVESKFSDTADTVYFRSFKCNA